MATLGATPSTTEFPSGAGFQVDTDGTLKNGLLGFWRVDEPIGPRRSAVLGGPDFTAASTTSWSNATTANDQSIGSFYSNSSSLNLQIADTAWMPTGHNDWTISIWGRLTTLAASAYLVTRYVGAGNQRSFIIGYGQSGDELACYTYDGTNYIGGVVADTSLPDGPDVDTWYNMVCWHNATADTVNIRVNDIATDSYSHSGGTFDSSAPLQISATGEASATWNGYAQDMGYWNKVLSAQEITDLYNSGSGNTWVN